MKRGVLIGIAVVIAAVAAGILSLRFDEGGGQSLASPDGRYVAHASSLQRRGIIARDAVCAEIRVVSSDGIEVRRLVTTPVRSSEPTYFRDVPNLIAWSADSRTVTVAYDGLEQRIQVDR